MDLSIVTYGTVQARLGGGEGGWKRTLYEYVYTYLIFNQSTEASATIMATAHAVTKHWHPVDSYCNSMTANDTRRAIWQPQVKVIITMDYIGVTWGSKPNPRVNIKACIETSPRSIWTTTLWMNWPTSTYPKSQVKKTRISQQDEQL